MIASLFRSTEKAKAYLMERFNMEKLLLTMMRVISLCIMRISKHNQKFLVGHILKSGKFLKWMFLKENNHKSSI